ncbi:MAG: hypothetical protein CO149_07400 [Nitrospirae bacterium CG_4_9_14_3_um_filter_51_5]|nr:MAG: hypothetical protein CO149_07400 [Nitrospirae bacterium CG_4_9_14_3_um_filter_51_5]
MKRLLVVDDNEDMHLMLGDPLEAMGYGVLKAGNGLEALNVLAVVPVVGVLLDLDMPAMDGLRLLTELKHRHMQAPVIVMSAGNDDKTFAKALELGAIDYLHKPLNVLQLAVKCARFFE